MSILILKSYKECNMLKIFSILLLTMSFSLYADVHVNGYQKQNGSYVQPHMRSSPNSTSLDNWSTQGNTNPYTGAAGTKPAY